MSLYKTISPLLFNIKPETAHSLTLKAMRLGAMPKYKSINTPALEQTICGLKFPNPVGLAAGFDKNAEVIAPSFHLGFGFVEVGTVTPKPQDGNPKPRIFRAPEHKAVINRMGFPNEGMEVFKDNLEKFLSQKARPTGVVGLNIGMNKNQKEPVKDYCTLIRMLAPMADYLTINISSPNTPGLRNLQKREPLIELLEAVKNERQKACRTDQPPLFVKLAPDLDDEQIKELSETLIEGGVDGVILTNTTLDRPNYLPKDFREEKGGLSGQPVTEKSTNTIRKFYAYLKGHMPIIGIGGISNAQQAYEKIKAGASLVQLYTGLIYEGPAIATNINSDLAQLIEKDGYKNISEAIGTKKKPIK